MIDFVLDDSDVILTYADAGKKTGFALDDRMIKYSEDQPRDDHGRWTDTGGGDAREGLLATIGQPDGGFTYNPVTGKQPKQGFAISIYKGREGVFDVKDLTATKLFEYAQKNWDLLKQPGNYLGGWHNPADDKVYLDVSRVVESADEAARLAKEYDQLAYFDLGSGTSIPTAKGKAYGLETVTASHWLARGRADAGGNLRVVPELDGEGTDGRGQGDGAGAVRRAEGVKYSDDQPRVPAGSPEGGQWTDWRVAWTRDQAEVVADAMSFPRERVTYTTEKKTFELNGLTYTEGGRYEREKGTVLVRAGEVFFNGPEEAKGVVAHEISHAMWGDLLKEQEREHAELKALPEKEFNRLMGMAGPRLEARAELERRFPVSSMLGRHATDVYMTDYSVGAENKLEKLAEDDGVSNYTKQYWSRAGNRQDGITISNAFATERAINETLADVSRIQLTGPKRSGDRASIGERWTKFATDMRATWRALQKSKK